MENNQKVSFVEKVAYGTGDMACNLFWALICVFAAIFYTDYFGISAAAAGTMMLVVRCIDITFDVIIGACADRVKTKFGRFRPWILYGALPFCVIGFITFLTPDFSQGMKLAYAYVTYAAFMLMYSVVNVPYGALMGVMSADPEERTSISAYRNILAQAGCFVVYGSTLTFVQFFSKNHTPQAAFSIIVGIYALVALCSLMFCFTQTKERIEPVHEQKNKLSDDLKDLVHNRPWICLTFAGITMLFFTVIHNNLTSYYAKYYVADIVVDSTKTNGAISQVTTGPDQKPMYVLADGTQDNGQGDVAFQTNVNGKLVNIHSQEANRGGDAAQAKVGDELVHFKYDLSGKLFGFIPLSWELFSTLLLTLGSIITIIGTILVKPLVSRFGKRNVWIACFVMASISSALFAFVPREGDFSLTLIVILQILFTLSIGPSGFIMWSMYADVADYSEVATGRRATGMIYSSATMAQKLGNALSGSLGLFALGAVGFLANDIAMSDATKTGILSVFAWLPLLGSILGVIALYFYNLDEATVEANAQKLIEMKAAAAAEETKAE